ncbi:mitochondrial fission ELM1 family protein [Sinorhizobium medicae]|uniref:mitochondrial fission ELM1 family protein n=1 Tax=Sinorhizobium medicae TaxID=110321 RepID=UPI000C7B1E89|nr:ELM1/GtrOC1 family putative glycosyltransferase [Sinorhizobium medicae]MDX0413403.1 nucleoside-diphosphate sugar epimerase [Sinorhizobium medicae]MDX0451130.1 nucleoside-diphosphate sugar epimerase [Sinorhizobium medicae]MDX0474444.1 nucleoside-diphosphate sugar epimerase [Sinorhizobium medicae]MDX0518202.1 nucleoside-diphosphate sugar epimerase [Sinorhizobium medicae]MDX0548972.1 nucleoside-diphosphate sugar epimerase [Sinorhizobium medicae]
MQDNDDTTVKTSNTSCVWAVAESKAGTLTQCLGVGKQFHREPVVKLISRTRGLRKLFEPRLFRKKEQRPELVVSCGFRAEPAVLDIKAAYGGKPVTVHLQRPRIEGYDLVFVSRHDWVDELNRRPNYHSMVGVPHQITWARLAPLRDAARRRLSPDGRPIVAVFVGGSNGAYVYDDRTHQNIKGAIEQLEKEGWRIVVSVSRRSEDHTQQALSTLNSESIAVWDRRSENPYLDYMAAADAFVIAKDSITMPCEALATGKPVFTLELTHVAGPRLDKFERYHRDLHETLQLTRPFEGKIEPYSYEPLDETRRIASVIRSKLDLQ